MAAGRYDFGIEQGATFERTFVWRDGAGALVDLTGYAARMQVRPSAGSPTVLLDATTANGLLTLTPAEGRIMLRVGAVTTAQLSFSEARYDLELESADGTVTRLLEGTVTVSREITR